MSRSRPLVLLAALLPAAPASAAPGAPFTNPLKHVKGADPWIVHHDGNHHLIATSFTGELQMRRSPTLAGLATAPSVRVWSDATPSRGTNMWAPELHSFDGRWYLYYSASAVGEPCCDSQRTHVLESVGSDPMGPYRYKSMLTGRELGVNGWLIDASVLRLNGRVYLLGSSFINGGPQSLVIAPMSDPSTVSGPFRLLSSPTHDWEKQGGVVNEGPEVLQRGGRTFLFYSASACWGPDYKLGRLTYTGGDPLNASSWRKEPTPVFRRDDAAGVYGPGHNGFFASPDGTEDWIVYHANDAASDGCDNGRTTRAQKVTWRADGTPDLGTPVALGTRLPGPSGETAATPTAHTLTNRNSGKCLDVVGGTGDGADVAQTTCTGAATQRWRFTDLGDDTSRLTNVGTGRVLDVADCGTADGTNVRQWSWLDNACQRFRPEVGDRGGWVRLANPHSGKVLDVADCGTADRADVRLWSWLNNPCQQWRLTPVA
ncbi:family 43 glycosylhydrolase [Actinomadura kijaniata]|uniref:family 43 glycosylhydrolase n=1 Tax=Actinomadura kijaniata TaxID=46161 RepID=UPI0008375DE7|nr:family 43 glycosylhydrolase [Actinomadura kijaniata]